MQDLFRCDRDPRFGGCLASYDFVLGISTDCHLPPATVSADLSLKAVLPPYFPTSIASRRTLDNFLLSTETLKTLQPCVDLIGIRESISDQLLWKNY